MSLIICNNLVKDPGAAALAQHKTLRHLDLSGNRISYVGAHALALNTTLRSLALSSNLVGDVGAVLLARNSTLSELLLSYNGIGDAGAFVLSENTHLQVLNLNYNTIHEPGSQALRANTTFKSLLLSVEQPPEFSEDNLDTIFSLSESFLCVADLHGTIQFFNPAFSRVLGCTGDELLTKTFFEFLHPDDKPLLKQQLSQQTKFVIQNFQDRYRCKDGSFRHIRWTAHTKYNRIYAIGTDITEQRQAEKGFWLAEQRNMYNPPQEPEGYSLRQTEFIARLSHEIRNPLGGIQGLVEVLQAQVKEAETMCRTLSCTTHPVQPKLDKTFASIAESLQDLLLCTEHQKAILDDNLDIAKITEKKLVLDTKTFEVVNTIRAVMQMLAARAIQKQLALSFQDKAATAQWVKGDPLRFKQILINLISNAIKFTNPGGRVEVTLTLQERSQHHARLKIDIADTGIGLSAEEASKLFERFAQAAQPTASQLLNTVC